MEEAQLVISTAQLQKTSLPQSFILLPAGAEAAVSNGGRAEEEERPALG